MSNKIWKEVTVVGLVDFIAPILGCAALAKYVLGWGTAASCTLKSTKKSLSMFSTLPRAWSPSLILTTAAVMGDVMGDVHNGGRNGGRP